MMTAPPSIARAIANSKVADEGPGEELWLFTMRFPFGNAEAFLENEVPVLCRHFKRVRIFPEIGGGPMRELPPNASATVAHEDPYRAASVRQLWAYRREVAALLRSLLRDVPWTRTAFREIRRPVSAIRQFIARLDSFSRNVMPDHDPERVTLYSFWTANWATLLGLLRMTHPEVRFVSRAHGFDLYEWQNKGAFIPFRAFQISQVDKVFCVSTAGLEHLQKQHPRQAGQFELFRLGTMDHGLSHRSPADKPLQVVSCSYLVPRKRVDLIIGALMGVRTPVHWTHFGDGPDRERLEAMLDRLPPHVSCTFAGNTDNRDILRHYVQNPVDVFLLMSYLEGGVAVALQEAASFGIPLVATDSGGVRDIMNANTGKLLPRHPDVAELAALLDGFRAGPMATDAFRAGVRAFWEEHFRAENAYARFCERLAVWHASAARGNNRPNSGQATGTAIPRPHDTRKS